jgi:hypothetical protein
VEKGSGELGDLMVRFYGFGRQQVNPNFPALCIPSTMLRCDTRRATEIACADLSFANRFAAKLERRLSN